MGRWQMFPEKSLVVIKLTVLLLCCCAVTTARTKPKKVTANESDNGTTVNLCAGDRLLVRLPAQPGTGYGWQLVQANRKKLRPQGQPVTEKKPGPAVGGTEYQLFRFVAKTSGTARVKLVYLRPWEKNKPPAKTYRLTVRIC